MTKSLNHLIFRANPSYDLLPFDRLDPEVQRSCADLPKQPGFYGLLQPRVPGGLSIKSVDQDTALLYYTLQTPGPIPAYVRHQHPDQIEAIITKLVLDGVLELEDGAQFVSGSHAYGVLCGAAVQPEGTNHITRLSLAALHYGQMLDVSDPLSLSARMYFYNRQPVTPALQRRFEQPGTVFDFLGLYPGSPTRRLLDQHWKYVEPQAGFEGWSMWRLRGYSPRRNPQAVTHKLYISPAFAALPTTLQTTLEVLAELRVALFKFGADIYGLLRPDKLVLYFESYAELQVCADLLAARLAGTPAHGTPFTAAWACDGLLSWGMDPPHQGHGLPWLDRESWRLWVTNRLATALLSARAGGSAMEPWRFAMERVRLEGVDVATWTPAAHIWQKN